MSGSVDKERMDPARRKLYLALAFVGALLWLGYVVNFYWPRGYVPPAGAGTKTLAVEHLRAERGCSFSNSFVPPLASRISISGKEGGKR